MIILILAIIVGFAMALAIGANDVANSMATAVGAKAITVKQAVIIAGIFEFSGAFFFGKMVTETIRKGIVNINLISNPNILIAGSFAALLSAALWILIATKFALPISTTHSIVGGMAGFGIIALGVKAVNWLNMGFIVLSWFISPFLGGLIGYFIFKFIAVTILRRSHPLNAAKKIGPFLIGLTFFIFMSIFFIKALHKKSLIYILYALIIGTFIGFISIFILKNIKLKNNSNNYEYLEVENMFKKIQIMTSCYVSLAHGSNDVANAIGPLAAIFTIVETGIISAKAQVPKELLILGGIGIAIGVALWGSKVMKSVGEGITELNNSKGFSVDFSTATTIFLASMLGLPVSSTHIVVGSITGVGYAKGFEALNVGFLKQIVLSWLLTVPLAAVTSAIFYKIIIALF